MNDMQTKSSRVQSSWAMARNSWVAAFEDQISYTDMKRTSVMILNTEFLLDDALKRRVRISQRAVLIVC